MAGKESPGGDSPTCLGFVPHVLHSVSAIRGTLQVSHQKNRILVRYGACPLRNFLRLGFFLGSESISSYDTAISRCGAFSPFDRDVKTFEKFFGRLPVLVPTS